MKKNIRGVVGFLAGVLLSTSPVFAADPDIEAAEALMREGKPAEAYTLLEPFEFEQSGNVRFDYLFGITALDSGKPDKATVIFERVLAVDPNFAGARLDMARAYFQLGDLARAKTEFQTVLDQNPPLAARATVEKYLVAIEQREKEKETSGSWYLEGTVGHDNNVNSSTSQTQIPVPVFNNAIFTLSPSNVKSGSDYAVLGMGGEITHQIKPALHIYAGGDIKSRSNRSLSGLNYFSADVHSGLAFGGNSHVVRVGVMAGDYSQDGKSNRQNVGLSVEWRHAINTSNQVSVFAQGNRYLFNPQFDLTADLSVNNFDQSLLGGSWLNVFADGKGVLFASVFSGDETNADKRADGGKRFDGLRLGGQFALTEHTEAFASASGQYGRYNKQNAAFQATRKDNQYDVALGLAWHISPVWLVRPQVSFSRNDSNITIYRFDRTDVSVTLRRDFK